MKEHVTVDQIYTTQQSAELGVKGMKLMMPFRNWCAVELPDGWRVCSSIRQAKKEIRRAGLTGASMLVSGKD